MSIFDDRNHWASDPAWLFTQIHPNIPKIQLQIILFLLFWDVLWIIKDLLNPLSFFLHEFQQTSQFLRTISNDPDLGRVAYNHEYTQIYIKISSFKSLIYIKLFLYFYRNSDTENNSSLFKTYAVDLRRLLSFSIQSCRSCYARVYLNISPTCLHRKFNIYANTF